MQPKPLGQAGEGALGPMRGEGAVAAQRDSTDKCSRGRVRVWRVPGVGQCSWREPRSR